MIKVTSVKYIKESDELLTKGKNYYIWKSKDGLRHVMNTDKKRALALDRLFYNLSGLDYIENNFMVFGDIYFNNWDELRDFMIGKDLLA